MDDKSRTMLDFEKEVAALINRVSMENESDTPDFILAEYLCYCLEAFNRATNHRKWWYRPKSEIVRPNPVTAFLKKESPEDWKAQEKKAIEMETDKAYSKMRQMPPNCT